MMTSNRFIMIPTPPTSPRSRITGSDDHEFNPNIIRRRSLMHESQWNQLLMRNTIRQELKCSDQHHRDHDDIDADKGVTYEEYELMRDKSKNKHGDEDDDGNKSFHHPDYSIDTVNDDSR